MKEMTITEHLTELRKVAIHLVVILITSFVICYAMGDIISDVLLAPLRASLGENDKIVYLGILDKVISQFQVSFWASIIVSAPLWFREFWCFLRPALYKNEIKSVRPFIFLGFILFFLGVCFGYFVIFPMTFQTLMSWGVSNIDATFSLKDYLVLCCKVLVFLGIIFQLPNIIIILALTGLVDLKMLNSCRRYVYAGFTVLAAMLTPPDVLTMLGLWVPLVLLFEIGTLGVFIVVRPIKKRQERKMSEGSEA